MKQTQKISAVIMMFLLMGVLLLTSFQVAIYGDSQYRFYEREYKKYQVADSLNMTMDNIMDVTDQMMAYLKGKRADLHVTTHMGGETREFFNEREIAHMEDVQGLFLKAIALRRICLVVCVVMLLFMILSKADLRTLLPSSLCIGTGLFFAVIAALAAIISTNFTKYFIMFHHIFFSNDLWILDPATDMLINIVPEGFFMDTAARIALLFGSLSLLLFGVCLLLTIKNRRKVS